MRKKKIVVLLATLSITLNCVAGCSKNNDMEQSAVLSTAVESVIPTDSNTDIDLPQETVEIEPSEEALPSNDNESKGFTFKDVADIEFSFSSGVGAWSTELDIREDGSFSGSYHDSDMGDTSDEYPKGTYYYSRFRGKFEDPVKINEYTYSTKIVDIRLDDEPGKEEIKDEMRYVYSEAYGINDAEEIYIFLPGAPVKDLPKEFVRWAYSLGDQEAPDEKLPFYGLYNVTPQFGFSSYEIEHYAIDDEIEKVLLESKKIEHQIEGDVPQLEMNLLSSELYKLWDDELNSMWKRMKEVVDPEEMKTVLTEQRKWIKDKETQVKKAGEEVEGGSMQPFVENTKAAELTKIRVYELATYLRK